MKFALFMLFVLTTFKIVITGDIEEIVAEACKEIEKNFKEIESLALEITKLQNRLNSIEKDIHEETNYIINEVIQQNQETLALISKINKEECRIKATKDLDVAFNLTTTDINLGCQQETNHKIINLSHDLNQTLESLSKLNETNSEIIQFCFNNTGQQVEELEKCFKAEDNDVKIVIKKYEEIINNLENQIADIEANVDIVIKCIQASSWIFNQMTDRIIADMKKCDM